MSASASNCPKLDKSFCVAVFFAGLGFLPREVDALEGPKLLALGIAAFLGTVRFLLADRRFVPPAWVCLLLAAGIATALSQDPFRSLAGSEMRADGLLAWLAGFGVALGARTVPRETLVRGLMPMGAVAGAYGGLQALGLDPLPWAIGADFQNQALTSRSFSFLGNPSFLGLFCAAIVPVAWADARSSPGRTYPWLCLAGCLVGIGTSGSRSALLGALLGTAYLLGRVPSARDGRMIAAAVATLGLASMLTPLGTVQRTVRTSPASWEVRTLLAQEAVVRFRERPLTGWGPAMVEPLLAESPLPFRPDQRENPSTHNVVLDLALAGGVLLLIPAGWAILESLSRGRDPSAVAGLLAAGTALQFGFASVGCLAVIAVQVGITWRADPGLPGPDPPSA